MKWIILIEKPLSVPKPQTGFICETVIYILTGWGAWLRRATQQPPEYPGKLSSSLNKVPSGRRWWRGWGQSD